MELRLAETRGRPEFKWYLDSRRTFSFPGYYDARYMNFSHFRTLNDDRMEPGYQTGWHPHQDMEIFGYVVEGFCRHRDSLGHDVEVPAGGVQRMSAGTGLYHEESNSAEHSGRNRYLQMWITPKFLGGEPVHDYVIISRELKLNTFFDVTSLLPIRQDARLLAGIFTQNFVYDLRSDCWYYLYMVRGQTCLNGVALKEGDGLSFGLKHANRIRMKHLEECEIIMFELAPGK